MLTELPVQHPGIADLIATEVVPCAGRCTGNMKATLNMREGKVARLLAGLGERGLPATLIEGASFYSDSANDLPLSTRWPSIPTRGCWRSRRRWTGRCSG